MSNRAFCSALAWSPGHVGSYFICFMVSLYMWFTGLHNTGPHNTAKVCSVKEMPIQHLKGAYVAA